MLHRHSTGRGVKTQGRWGERLQQGRFEREWESGCSKGGHPTPGRGQAIAPTMDGPGKPLRKAGHASGEAIRTGRPPHPRARTSHRPSYGRAWQAASWAEEGLRLQSTTATPLADSISIQSTPLARLLRDRLETPHTRLLLRSHPICKACATLRLNARRRLLLRSQARCKEKRPHPAPRHSRPYMARYTIFRFFVELRSPGILAIIFHSC